MDDGRQAAFRVIELLQQHVQAVEREIDQAWVQIVQACDDALDTPRALMRDR